MAAPPVRAGDEGFVVPADPEDNQLCLLDRRHPEGCLVGSL
ncbi:MULTISPECIES: hypothetical protein [unclassified Nonomuraea]